MRENRSYSVIHLETVARFTPPFPPVSGGVLHSVPELVSRRSGKMRTLCAVCKYRPAGDTPRYSNISVSLYTSVSAADLLGFSKT